MSEVPASRLEHALAAFLRQEFGASVAAISGFVDILIEDADRQDLDTVIPDLKRVAAAASQLSELIARTIEAAPKDDSGAVDHSRLRHDLRTPLNAIKGYTELLIEEAREAGHDGLLPDLAKILDLAGRLLGDIDRMVDFGSGDMSRRPLDIVGRALATVRSLGGADAPDLRALTSRLLVVDDNPSNRDLLARRLVREGHLVTTAASGRQALALVESEAFDLVLLDLMMPEMSGFEVLSKLKAEERSRHIPIIMISALDELDSTARCIEAGAEDYLPKPFNPVLLRARINACLEKKRLRDREQDILAELRAEKERSEALLLNILPQPIVERLHRGERVVADRIAEATILFSDIVDFTSLTAHLSAEQMVDLLGSLFSRFDELAARHGLEKIKTIGDGYMAAGGVPEPRKDHAAAVAALALEMREVTATMRRSIGQSLQLRIGVHTGNLVAGVIGTHKFVYDVWGDTVNTAKRMESYGEPDRIHISAATRMALGSGFRCQSRGPLEVKGKGLMETFFLEPAR